MKYELIWTALVCSLFLTLTSCGNEPEVDHVTTLVTPGAQTQPDAPGLVGTFSGIVQNTSHTRTGTLTIYITAYDRTSGALTGALKLSGFSECFTKGIFPDPNHNNYDNRYSPHRGFGTIQASGTHPGSHSFLYFEKSDDFNQGLRLGVDELGFYDGSNWCLLIDPVVLKRQ
jgi:hypothetical protein